MYNKILTANPCRMFSRLVLYSYRTFHSYADLSSLTWKEAYGWCDQGRLKSPSISAKTGQGLLSLHNSRIKKWKSELSTLMPIWVAWREKRLMVGAIKEDSNHSPYLRRLIRAFSVCITAELKSNNLLFFLALNNLCSVAQLRRLTRS